MIELSLGGRVIREHRRLLLSLTIALMVNLVIYLFAVRPLSNRVANIAQRDTAAERSLTAARKEHAVAAGTLTGKDKASAELARFYRDVLPRDLASARRLTHVRVPDIAKQSNVDWFSTNFSPPTRARESGLVKLSSKLELAGRYRDVRAFIHKLETAPEFVVLDDVSLSEEDTEGGLLLLTLQLSTYYQAGAE